MKKFSSIVTMALLLGLAACDDSGAGGGGGGGDWSTDSGSGTGALLVDAHVEGEAGDSTHMEVEVYLDGQPVSGAEVRIDSELGEVTLNESSAGYYSAHQDGFAPSYKLYVTSGEDYLDATLESPEPHEIESPTPGSTYDAAGGDLLVTWSPTGAQFVEVESDEAEIDLDGDPGEAVIPASEFESDEDEVRVERSNEIALSGGAAESDFEVSYRDRVEFEVLNPAD